MHYEPPARAGKARAEHLDRAPDVRYAGSRTASAACSPLSDFVVQDRCLLKSIIAISGGATLGALLRWWLGSMLDSHFPTIPPGTLAANLIGGYVVGVAVAFFATFTALAPEWRLFVT